MKNSMDPIHLVHPVKIIRQRGSEGEHRISNKECPMWKGRPVNERRVAEPSLLRCLAVYCQFWTGYTGPAG